MRLRFTHILLLFALTIQLKLNAQPVDWPSYTFVNTAADTFVFYGTSEQQFNTFVNKFSSMIRKGQRQIGIVHIGDSHLQADLFTGQVRKNLQTFTSGLDGTRGMVTPYTKGGPDSYKVTFSPSWHSFNILNQSDKANNGLWGTTAYTTARENTVIVNVNNRNPVKYDFNVMRVYHSELAPEDNIAVVDIETAYSKAYYPQKGYTEFVFASYISEVKISVTKQSSDTFYLYGFYFDDGSAGVVYNVTGTNGATAQNYLYAEAMERHLSSIPTDMVVISLGTNDTYEPGGENTFKDNLTALVKKIKETVPTVPIVLTTPVECYWHKKNINPRQQMTVDIIRSVAENTSCIFLDMYSVMGGRGSADKLFTNGLMQADKIHLTAKGYQMEGDLFYNALWNEMEKKF